MNEHHIEKTTDEDEYDPSKEPWIVRIVGIMFDEIARLQELLEEAGIDWRR